MDVSIIIVNYNTCDLTLQCLQSVYEKTTNIDFEVIVVDNASSDDSVSAIRQQYSQVQVIESPRNLGFGMANNLGVKSARGKYLFLLNSDTILQNNSVYEFFRYWNESDNVHIGCLGSYLENIHGRNIHSFGVFPFFFRFLKHKIFGCRCKPLTQGEYAVDYITGADLFISRENFMKVGMFNPLFFMYYEETWLQLQLSRLKLDRIIIPSPKIVHLEGCSYKQKLSNKKRIQMDVSLFVFWKLYYGKIVGFVLSLLYLGLKIPVFLKSEYTFDDNKNYYKSVIKSL